MLASAGEPFFPHIFHESPLNRVLCEPAASWGVADWSIIGSLNSCTLLNLGIITDKFHWDCILRLNILPAELKSPQAEVSCHDLGT